MSDRDFTAEGWYVCPECGGMRHIHRHHVCWTVGDIASGVVTDVDLKRGDVPRQPPVWTLPPAAGKDKALIWDDCAECAVKHLSACFAAITSGSAPVRAPAVDVLRARAWVALGEAESGYTGNAELATGCLALAENLSDDQTDAKELREARLRIPKAGVHEARLSLTRPAMAALAGAHFTEALRELPALADRIAFSARTGDIGFNVDDPAEFLDMLRKNIAWVVSNYELRGAK